MASAKVVNQGPSINCDRVKVVDLLLAIDGGVEW